MHGLSASVDIYCKACICLYMRVCKLNTTSTPHTHPEVIEYLTSVTARITQFSCCPCTAPIRNEAMFLGVLSGTWTLAGLVLWLFSWESVPLPNHCLSKESLPCKSSMNVDIKIFSLQFKFEELSTCIKIKKNESEKMNNTVQNFVQVYLSLYFCHFK